MPELIPNPSEIIKETKNVLPQTVEAIDHALSTVANTVNTVLTPIEYLNTHAKHCMDKVKLKLQKELAEVEPEKIITPPPYIAVPALTAASYCVDCNELHDLFAKLLAKSMNAETTYQVHPSFIEIIKQLSPFDAKLIKETSILTTSTPSCSIRCQQKSEHYISHYKEISSLFKNTTAGYEIFRCITFFDNIDCHDYILLSQSLENIMRLGLIVHDTTSAIEKAEFYKLFANKEIELKAKEYNKILFGEDIKNDTEITFSSNVIDATNYGKQFYDICVK